MRILEILINNHPMWDGDNTQGMTALSGKSDHFFENLKKSEINALSLTCFNLLFKTSLAAVAGSMLRRNICIINLLFQIISACVCKI